MSRKKRHHEENNSKDSLFFLPQDCKITIYFTDDEESDEDYCDIEDRFENFAEYFKDNMPYEISIPKKEVYDVLHDPDK